MRINQFAKPTTTNNHDFNNRQQSAGGCSPAPNVLYLSTLDGLLKSLQIVLNFLCFLCITVGGYYFFGIGPSIFVAVSGFCISLIFLLLYVFSVTDNYDHVPWILLQIIFCSAWAILNFISGSVLGFAAIQQDGTFGWAIGAFFAFSTMIAYAFDCYIKFSILKHEVDQSGEHV